MAAVDRDQEAIASVVAEHADGVESVVADLEGGPWPFEGRVFSLVVVTNYLWRPLLPRVLDAVAPGGLLLYETFLEGQERFGRPTNPEFLLRRGELLRRVDGAFDVVAFEEGEDGLPPTAMRQRICARRRDGDIAARWHAEPLRGRLGPTS